MNYDFNIPGPVVFAFVLYAGALTVGLCAVLGSTAYAIILWADHKWGKPK